MNPDHARATEQGRGRQANAPKQIPLAGWKDIVLRTFKEVKEDRVTLIAAGVTYCLLLAVFPAIAATVAIYGLVADPSTVQSTISTLARVLPEGGLAIIEEQLEKLTAQGTPTLGIALLVSVALALWSASSGVKALFEAMNIAYDETEERGFIHLNALALLFTMIGVVGATLMLTIVVGLPAALGFLGLGAGTELLVQGGAYVLLVALLVGGLAGLYRFGPSRKKAKWRWITPGAALAVLTIVVVSGLFSWYAANFANYEKTYGSMGALIGFLFWIWICVNVVIVGAELNSEIERQTTQDSTVGESKALGQRDATVADTVGRSAHGIPAQPRAANYSSHNGERRRQRFPKPVLPLGVAIPAMFALHLMRRRAERR